MSKSDAAQRIAELTRQLAGVGGGGVSEYKAICDDDSSKNRYFAFIIEPDVPRVPYPPPRNVTPKKNKPQRK
jgi:hypothetical protein